MCLRIPLVRACECMPACVWATVRDSHSLLGTQNIRHPRKKERLKSAGMYSWHTQTQTHTHIYSLSLSLIPDNRPYVEYKCMCASVFSCSCFSGKKWSIVWYLQSLGRYFLSNVFPPTHILCLPSLPPLSRSFRILCIYA